MYRFRMRSVLLVFEMFFSVRFLEDCDRLGTDDSGIGAFLFRSIVFVDDGSFGMYCILHVFPRFVPYRIVCRVLDLFRHEEFRCPFDEDVCDQRDLFRYGLFRFVQRVHAFRCLEIQCERGIRSSVAAIRFGLHFELFAIGIFVVHGRFCSDVFW